MTDALLTLTGVHTHIGNYHILHGVDLLVPRGEVTLLLGRNGAGKTTTLRTIMALNPASSGTIAFDGKPITAWTTPEIAKAGELGGIAYVPENMGIFADLTVKENILLAARSAKRESELDAGRLAWIFEVFPPVKTFWNTAAGKLSGGQKQMLSVARAIIEPRGLLLIDEPSKGLAPAIVDNMLEAFLQLKARGTTVLLVEQNIHFAKRLGDSVSVMDNGRVVHAGAMAELMQNEALQRQWLGLSV